MKWVKISIGVLFSYPFAYLGYLSFKNGKSIGISLVGYDLIGWKAYVMGVGWLGATLCIFSLFCLGEKLEKARWNRAGASFGGVIFGICLCIVATASLINMVSKSAF